MVSPRKVLVGGLLAAGARPLAPESPAKPIDATDRKSALATSCGKLSC